MRIRWWGMVIVVGDNARQLNLGNSRSAKIRLELRISRRKRAAAACRYVSVLD